MCKVTLYSDRLALRPFTEADITAEYLSWLNDKTLMAFSEQRHRRHNYESSLGYLRSFDGTDNCFWAIEAKPLGGSHIGNINAYVDMNNLVADLGILVGHKDARGRGFGLEAWDTVIDYFFDETDVRKITAGFIADNRKMRTVAERAGMIEDGLRKKHFICGGKEVDVVYMALFAESREKLAE